MMRLVSGHRIHALFDGDMITQGPWLKLGMLEALGNFNENSLVKVYVICSMRMFLKGSTKDPQSQMYGRNDIYMGISLITQAQH
jgi:hypothetical protein